MDPFTNNQLVHPWAILSPVSFAEAVMQDLENQTLANDMHIKLWDSYVDDTFSIIKTHHIKKVFDTINNTTDGIIFTMEKEKNGEIAFLDIKLSRTERTRTPTKS